MCGYVYGCLHSLILMNSMFRLMLKTNGMFQAEEVWPAREGLAWWLPAVEVSGAEHMCHDSSYVAHCTNEIDMAMLEVGCRYIKKFWQHV